MGIGGSRDSLSPIGLDLCGHEVSLAQLVRRSDGWHLLAAARISRPQGAAVLDDAIMARIHEVILRQGFRGTDVSVCLPSVRVHVDLLELPPRASGAPIDALARAEMARVAQCENEPFELATWEVPPPPRGGTGTSLMGIAAKEKDVLEYLDPLIDGGLRPVALTPDALANAACARSQSATDTTAVLDLGWTATSVVFVTGGVPVHHRVLPDHDLDRLVRLVAEELQISAEEAACILRSAPDEAAADRRAEEGGVARLTTAYLESVATEFESSLTFAGHRFPGRPVNRLLLTGPGAHLDGVAEWCRTRFEEIAEAKVLRPSDVAKCPAAFKTIAEDPTMLRAVGLAVGGVDARSAGSPLADLMPIDRREGLARGKRYGRWAVGLGVEVLVLLVVCLSVHLAGGEGPAKARAAAVAAEADERQAKASLDHAQGELRKAKASLESLADRADWSILLAALAQNLGDDAVLNKVSLRPAGAGATAPGAPAQAARPVSPKESTGATNHFGLELRGVASSQAAVSKLLLRLQAIPVFEGVTLVRTGRDRQDDSSELSQISFEIRVELFDRGGAR